jgi:hypothetical protein
LKRQAEEFWELPAGQYAALHAELDGWSGDVFRGVRFYPFSDPLAYLRGRAERRRIAGMARSDRAQATGLPELLLK